ncbi:MAG TPA: glycosyltransferase [Firmicutes bacterium]|nr:glycosyltransferase [Bacillota bacterium]
MLAAVVPAQNEEKRISQVLRCLRALGPDVILPVVNGCTDGTLDEIGALGWPEIRVINFRPSLGIDVPRAVGAKAARDLGADCVLFVDGDMVGDLASALEDLVAAVGRGAALALTNCYPSFASFSHLTRLVLAFRRKLNKGCGLEDKIGVASPSHGPLAVSREFLFRIPLQTLAIPPVALVTAHLYNLPVEVAATIPHAKLKSAIKDDRHAQLVADTIIGDCLEALCIYQGRPPSRTYCGREFLGYHPRRRWDLLADYLEEEKDWRSF